MIIGVYSWAKELRNNQIFSSEWHSAWGADGHNNQLISLARKLREAGHEIETVNERNPEKYVKLLFLDYPEWRMTGAPDQFFQERLRENRRGMYLLCMETPVIKPNNWNRELHTPFERIFTWHDEYVDGRKYLRTFFTTHSSQDIVEFSISEKERLCAMVARQKYSDEPAELYSERLRAIRWYERNHPDDFDLYGQGWDRYVFRGKFKKLNLIDYYIGRVAIRIGSENPIGRGIMATAVVGDLWASAVSRGRPLFPSYRGPIATKRPVLRRHRFSFCYENSIINGWITEKIFDSFFAGCVPVYLGDPNIGRLIPRGCYIDRREFGSYKELHAYLKGMSDAEYLGYVNSIRNFLQGPDSEIFTIESFARTIMGGMGIC